jgi:hypothetical protein
MRFRPVRTSTHIHVHAYMHPVEPPPAPPHLVEVDLVVEDGAEELVTLCQHLGELGLACGCMDVCVWV